jgi:site-specific DNA-methyltransferase (adenine-specific)
MTPKPITRNTLFSGDNLPILREHIPSESVDLVYLDPPFNSNRSYNVLFKDESGISSEAQITAFDDTWHWGKIAEETYYDLIAKVPVEIAKMIGSVREFIGANQMMAYLVMMTNRLIELHRVLKSTGSLYLHCDPTVSHYLKVILDAIFGPQNFRNEIMWRRIHSHNDPKNYGNVLDSIFYYVKSQVGFTWNRVFIPYTQEYIDTYYRHVDESGRRYQLVSLRSPQPRPNLTYDYKGYKPHPIGWAVSLGVMEQLDKDGRLYFPIDKNGAIREKYYLDEMPGVPLQNSWDDIGPISAQATERLGYPTQKPLALLERIIQASSNPGDIVLDPFCGCGTAVAAAQKLNRRWIGIDITFLSITLQKYRLKDMFGISEGVDYDVVGEPTNLTEARQLARDDRYQFQWWALSLVKAKPVGGEEGSKKGKKGSDKGIDGVINFIDDPKGKSSSIIVQVKSGHIKSGDIRDLIGTVENQKAALGVFVCLDEPTPDMTTEAVKAGYYISDRRQQNYPKIQILTVKALLSGAQIQMPPSGYGTFKQAPKAKKEEGKQGGLGI